MEALSHGSHNVLQCKHVLDVSESLTLQKYKASSDVCYALLNRTLLGTSISLIRLNIYV